MPTYCPVSRDLSRELNRLDREEEMERWIEAGRPDCPWDGDPEAMQDHCYKCTLKACELNRKRERADQLSRFLWDLGEKSMRRGA